MKRMTRCAHALAACALLGATAAHGWDHRAMQTHHAEAIRRPHVLAPGEVRVGPIEIGVPASASAQVPRTSDTGAGPAGSSAPRIRAARSDRSSER